MKLPILFWPSVSLRDHTRLPAKPGLYAVRWLFITWYVGKSVNVRDRWRRHHRYPQAKRLPWCRIAYCTMRESAIHDAEKRLIKLTKRWWVWNGEEVPTKRDLFISDVLGILVNWIFLAAFGVLIFSFVGDWL